LPDGLFIPLLWRNPVNAKCTAADELFPLAHKGNRWTAALNQAEGLLISRKLRKSRLLKFGDRAEAYADNGRRASGKTRGKRRGKTRGKKQREKKKQGEKDRENGTLSAGW
jgi:hypothetical protein